MTAPAPVQSGRAPDKPTGIALSVLISRLIWLCLLPLLLLALWLAADSILTLRAQHDQQAANLARNTMTGIDRGLAARIAALNILAVSPLLDDQTRWKDLYGEAQGFYQSFGTHVILSDVGTPMRMLLNTRVPFGTALPDLPRPAGQAAAPTALATAKPAVGDIVMGPVARAPLVAIAVPALRQGRPAFVMLTLFETRRFAADLAEVALPAGWSLTLRDGRGETIARRAPPGSESAAQTDADAPVRFLASSKVSPWSVAVEIPPDQYRAPLLATAAALGAGLLAATLTGVLGGMLASRRVARAVASLAQTPAPGAPFPDIREIAAVRRRLDAAAERSQRDREALRLGAATLERRVESRTAELAAANRELESFAYAVSHDLRAPLRAMRGFSQALIEDHGERLAGEARLYLDQIERAGSRMGDLIEGLLTLSHSTLGELSRDTVDLSRLAQELLDELARGDPWRTVAVSVQPGIQVHGDRRMLEAALRNLLGNAWKYTSKTAQASIRVYAEMRGGERWICVADNGAGFAMEGAGKLFQPFQRLHGPDEFPGLGIGLATVRRIVHRHGGTIEAHGEPGRGAVLRFTLPT